MTFDPDDNATEFIELHFNYEGNFDDASMGILTPVIGKADELEPGPQGLHSEPGSRSK